MLRLLIAFVSAILTTGCAISLKARVTQFHALDASARSFVILPSEDQADSLEFRSYANLVSEQLVARGWRQQSFNTADVAVFVQYQISQGREVAFSYPVFGQVPFGPATTTGQLSTSGSTSTFTATTRQNTAVGVVGTGTGSRVDYDRAVQLTMYSAPAYRESRKMERLYEATIRSSGTTGDLAAVMPTLVRGLLQDFPGTSGGSRSVLLLIK